VREGTIRVDKVPCVYILASKPNGTLYIGVTSDLPSRMSQHAQGLLPGFTRRYGVTRLVYYEMHDDMDTAIARETRLKSWKRVWKIKLIESMNPAWDDLYDARTGAIVDGPADAERLAGEPVPEDLKIDRAGTRDKDS
jgi:putative endonuclease